ncbi:hypothetical protein A2U01_0030347, partial [Trifolium medium]|nr:hypothetical protein [Trifolium medium]
RSREMKQKLNTQAVVMVVLPAKNARHGSDEISGSGIAMNVMVVWPAKKRKTDLMMETVAKSMSHCWWFAEAVHICGLNLLQLTGSPSGRKL